MRSVQVWFEQPGVAWFSKQSDGHPSVSFEVGDTEGLTVGAPGMVAFAVDDQEGFSEGAVESWLGVVGDCVGANSH